MLEEYLQPKIRQKNKQTNKQNGTLGENSVGREEGIQPYILNKLSAKKVSRVTSLP